MWSELSELDRKILYCISETGSTKVSERRKDHQMKPELFSVYRERLKRKGVIDVSQYGHVSLALPRFDIFVKSVFTD